MRKLVIFVSLILFTLPSFAQTPEEIFKGTCAMCHSSGVGGAPVVGNSEQWAPRIEKGVDALVSNVSKGIGIMPPSGGRKDLSVEELRSVIQYMIEQSQ